MFFETYIGAFMQRAISCILTCLASCHKLKWALNDICWPNIINVDPTTWVLINADLAKRFGEAVPPMNLRPPGDEFVACAVTDLYIFHLLLEDLRTYLVFDHELEAMRHLLSIPAQQKAQIAEGLLVGTQWLWQEAESEMLLATMLH